MNTSKSQFFDPQSVDASKSSNASEWFRYLLSKVSLYYFTPNLQENLAAFRIQCYWRERRARKLYLINKRRRAYEIKVYVTSLNIDIETQTDQERIKYILDAMKLKYKWLDLNDPKIANQETINEIKGYGGSNNLPIIVINGNFIGGMQELQELVDERYLTSILERQYEDQCLQCQVTRETLEDNICKFCWKKYNFFVKKFDDSLHDLFSFGGQDLNTKQPSALKRNKSIESTSKTKAQKNQINKQILRSQQKEDNKRSSSQDQEIIRSTDKLKKFPSQMN
ncbi:UNKNOWN [Stylonychia lemnae]|uniref:Uncharacterized protein n=1 Tax=Stylonychia lemnae TaxID=5949 RepID=A0A078AIE3_STYLE|nr:UNKNOWN [Stylonychia lemnae]|eukprot:CDW81711.1 UNKNOWN [Stylonychia lemnae]